MSAFLSVAKMIFSLLTFAQIPLMAFCQKENESHIPYRGYSFPVLWSLTAAPATSLPLPSSFSLPATSLTG